MTHAVTHTTRAARRIGAASRVEVEYFCRRCKGHYAASVPVASVRRTRCHCGSDDLLIYNFAGEFTSPMR